MAPPSSAHVQLGDVPRAPIQQSVEGEFRQHDGVMTVMMFYRRRASPKHRYDMTEVEYGGRGHRTRLRNNLNDQLVCLEVPPASIYKGANGGGGRRPGGVLLLPGVGLPSTFPCPSRRGGRRGGKGGSAAPPSLSNSD